LTKALNKGLTNIVTEFRVY